MNDEQLFLASAYLDGDLTADERARVESEPELLALVDRLRVLAADVGAVEAPDAGRRELALSAALAAFDDTRELGGAGGLPESVVPLRRSVANRWLSVAAALLVVGVLGTVAFGALSGRTGVDTDDGVDGAASQMAIDDDASRSAASLDPAGVAESEAVAEDMSESDTALVQAPDAGDSGNGDSGDGDSGDGDSGIASASATMRTADDLAVFASELLAGVAPADRTDDTGGIEPPCPGAGEVVGLGLYRDRPVYVTVGAEPVEPTITLAPGALIVSAVDTSTCAVAAQTVLDQGD
jgi:hypothetical protein